MTTTQQQNIPALRFPEFTGEWPKKPLREFVPSNRKITYGIVQPGKFVEQGVPLVRGGDYSFGWVPLSQIKRVTDEIDRPYKRSKLKAGDLLLTIVGANTGTVAVVPDWLNDANITQTTARIGIDSEKGSSGFIEQCLLSSIGQNEVKKYIKGAAQPGLNLSDIEKFKICSPHLQEQQKIASFLSAVDRKIEQLGKKKTLLQHYKKGMMQKLFSRQIRFKDDQGNDFPDWEEKRLGDVAEFHKGKGISKNDIDENGMLECIRYGQLYTDYRETIRDVVSRTNVPAGELILSEANDIIIPASGETQIDIATASCVLKSGVALGGDLNIIKTKHDGVFLSYYLNSVRKIDIARLSQGISVVHLYAAQLKQLQLILPKKPEQQKIAAFLSVIDNKIDLLSIELEQAKLFKKGLLQQMFI